MYCKLLLYIIVIIFSAINSQQAGNNISTAIENEVKSCSEFTDCYSCVTEPQLSNLEPCIWCTTSGKCTIGTNDSCPKDGRGYSELECSRPIPEQFAYNETFARNIMMPLAATAYSSRYELCLVNILKDGTLLRLTEQKCDPKVFSICRGYIAISNISRAIVIGFRGELGMVQYIAEYIVGFFNIVPFIGGGKVSGYVKKSFYKLWDDGLYENLKTAVINHPTYEIWLTGHSLGGSMATLASHVISAQKLVKPEQIKLITFGEGRSGDQEFARVHDKLVPYSYRIVNADDLIVHMLPQQIGQYYHHRYEIWYKDGMSFGQPYLTCLKAEDPDCSARNPIRATNNHKTYFNRDIQLFGLLGCPVKCPFLNT